MTNLPTNTVLVGAALVTGGASELRAVTVRRLDGAIRLAPR